MTTINLHQVSPDDENNFSYRTFGGGFFFSLAILIVTLLVFIGLKFYVPTLEKQNTILKNTIESENKGLAGLSSLENIIDMQTRLQEINNNLLIKNKTVERLQMTQILDRLGDDVNVGTVVSSYKYEDGGKISVTFEAGNYNDAARQILNFKSSDYFANASLKDISREDKSIACDIEMSIKQK